MRDRRREKLEKELAAVETEFRTLLVDSLRRCANGYWGLLAQNPRTGIAHLDAEIHQNSGARELIALGQEIEAFRSRLGSEPFPLYERFLSMRGRQSSNQQGEPKLAQAWLDELGE